MFYSLGLMIKNKGILIRQIKIRIVVFAISQTQRYSYVEVY